jgi:Zn2+/Cd2+-exporting ATPase
MKQPKTDDISPSDNTENTNQYNISHQGNVLPFMERLGKFGTYFPATVSLVLLLAGIALDSSPWFAGWVGVLWYIAAYLPVGFPVVKRALTGIPRGDVFNEFFLMSVATIGAFAIGEYPEGVAVMLFYAVGELFQQAAVNAAKRSIKALLDVRPDSANVLRNGRYETVDPTTVVIGETVQVKPGEKVPLDGTLLSGPANFDTAALTGESKPRTMAKGETVFAGMLNLTGVTTLEVTKKFEDSSLAKILDLVQNATKRKAKTERFIHRFAKVYTPIVVGLAVLLTFLPFFFIENYQFTTWLYRALVFLVISCPCALVVSIPLGYFGGIGAASRNGILFKGSNYLDLMMRVNTVVMDKTGTLTKGVFKVQQVECLFFEKEKLTQLTAALESKSTHPAALAIVEYAGKDTPALPVSNVEEIAGHGLKGTVDSLEVLSGNLKLLKKFGIGYDANLEEIPETIVAVAVNGKYRGYFIIADELKEDAQHAVHALRRNGVKTLVILSGDKRSVVQRIARILDIDEAFGDLLPEQKVEKLQELKSDPTRVIAFVGDGINDAPSLALADVGIAMGALGSDVAVETADVVLQTDQPSKIAQAIQIGKATNRVVWQNIVLAFGVKVVVLALGAVGVANMWEAVFADVGVALLAIFNAARIQRMKFS